MATETTPRCPLCNRPGETAGEFFRCPVGCGFFDGADDGGDYFDDPTKRAELADEREAKRRATR